jgi:hypothetical protein
MFLAHDRLITCVARVEVGLLIFGVAMFAETYFKVAYRSFSLEILEVPIGGTPLGYVLGALGLLAGVGIFISRRMRPPSRS